ncbi:MAG: hypothetical protein Q7U91_08030 [Sideroxyarcus sp.]|nr:hypothetical protein [Sideroxyarcus sp.]
MLSLEPINAHAKPVFRDASTCAQWLSQLQLTNLNLAHSTLRAQLDEFNRFPLRAKERLKTLEALREPVATVQADYAKKLYGKKLPLADEEFTVLITLSNLWLSMLNGYLRCQQAQDTGDSSVSSDAALLAHRCMLYSGLQIGEFLRAGCEPDGKSWQRLHTIYARVEEQGLQRQAVTDKLSLSSRSVSCLTAYTKVLLLHRARLHGFRRNQWQTLDLWLDRWGDAYSMEPQCSMSREDAPPLAVDLNGMRGLVDIYRATSAPGMRFLAMVPLSKLIRVKTILLQQGQSPRQLELGEEMNSKDCLDLLNKLHGCWCEQRPESLADEMREAPLVHLYCGLESIYAIIARKPFKAPTNTGISDKEVQRQIETFGRVLDQTDRHNLKELGTLAEEWLVEDDGLLHARLLRKSSQGQRFGLNQIVSIHTPGTPNHKLGVVTLVNVTRNGHLYIAVRYLPGNPQAVIARGTSFGSLASGAAAALVLPEIANLRIPASVILPRDWFQTGRNLELVLVLNGNKSQKVALGISVEKGSDFERASLTFGS